QRTGCRLDEVSLRKLRMEWIPESQPHPGENRAEIRWTKKHEVQTGRHICSSETDPILICPGQQVSDSEFEGITESQVVINGHQGDNQRQGDMKILQPGANSPESGDGNYRGQPRGRTARDR